MTSSGTYNFALSNGNLTLAALERCQIRGPSIRQEHLLSAQRELNLALAQFANKTPNLWTVELVSETLVDGTATYDVDPKVVTLLDVWISTNYGEDDQVDRYITPMSRTDYAGLSQKQTEGQPTTYWFDRQISPTITLWPVPNDDSWTLVYYACNQIQDANLAGGETPNVPYRWYDALTAELAYRIARIYKPELEAARKVDAKEAWDNSGSQDVENVNVSIQPSFSGYYR